MWIDAEQQKPEGVGQVLVIYKHPFFGGFVPVIKMGYYDSPDNYDDGDGRGWLDWDRDYPIKVTHWAPMPEISLDIQRYYDKMNK